MAAYYCERYNELQIQIILLEIVGAIKLNIYLVITLFGLALKLSVTYNIVFNYPKQHIKIKPELMAFVFVFITYSFIQILLFGPEIMGSVIGLQRIYVIRLYYFGDGISLIAGGYLLMSMFNVRFHKHFLTLLIIILFISVGGYFLLSTDLMVIGVRPGPRGLITLSEGAEYVYLGQIIVYICTAVILIALYRSYHSAKSNHAQVKNVYALAVALIYNVLCLIGLYKSYPILMATRGIIFYVVVLLILQRSRFFDLRPISPTTIEGSTLREFRHSFSEYTSEEIGYREMIKRIERSMVAYKLEKISGFKEGSGSSLPLVAKSMDVSLSSLYDILKRLDLDKPTNRDKQVF